MRPDGEPLVDGLPWTSSEVLDRVRAAMVIASADLTGEGEGRMLTKSFAAAVSLLVPLAVGATAQADPGRPAWSEAHFFDCTGPAGTPTSFDAELQQIGTAWHLTDSRQTFIVMDGFDETANTQVVVTPGFERNAVPAVTCRSVRAVSGHVFRVTGVLTPATGG
jgi:hypothetical protein